MSLPRFFLDEQVLGAETASEFPLRLSRDDAKHARVLRLKAGEHAAVVDASKDYFEVEFVSFDGDLPVVSIARHLDAPDFGPRVVLFQGLAKGDKMETVIRHATEVGVSGFVPLACKRSIMKIDRKKADSKRERWQAIAKSAAMQSGQPDIPEVMESCSVKEAYSLLSSFDAVLVCWEEAPATAGISQALSAVCQSTDASYRASVAIVVGPEGGLDELEVQDLLACNPHACLVTLGPSILRTETAGIVAPALVLYELGGMGRLHAQRDDAKIASEPYLTPDSPVSAFHDEVRL